MPEASEEKLSAQRERKRWRADYWRAMGTNAVRKLFENSNASANDHNGAPCVSMAGPDPLYLTTDGKYFVVQQGEIVVIA